MVLEMNQKSKNKDQVCFLFFQKPSVLQTSKEQPCPGKAPECSKNPFNELLFQPVEKQDLPCVHMIYGQENVQLNEMFAEITLLSSLRSLDKRFFHSWRTTFNTGLSKNTNLIYFKHSAT